MSRRPVRQLLLDMVERIDRIESFVVSFNRETFLRDTRTADAVVRNLEVLGEAANRLPTAFRERQPDIPWPRIIGLRNRIVHAYFDVDLELVWEILETELPRLKPMLRALEESSESDDAPGRS